MGAPVTKDKGHLRTTQPPPYCKEHLSTYIKKKDTNSDYILWFEIDKGLMKTTENLLIGATYIPPDNSVFYNEEEVVLLENEITSFSSKYKYIMLTGDFNARTSELRDYTERDEFLAEMFDSMQKPFLSFQRLANWKITVCQLKENQRINILITVAID